MGQDQRPKDKVSVSRTATHRRTSSVKIKSRRHSRCIVIKNTGYWLLGYFGEKNKKLTDNIEVFNNLRCFVIYFQDKKLFFFPRETF